MPATSGPEAAPPGDWVAGAFGLGEVRGEPTFAARGELGYVWRLATERGTWAVKRLVEPVGPETGEDVGFQLAVRAAGVPLPEPVRTPTGAAVVVGPDGVGHRVYAWVDFDPGGRVDPAAAGELLARIHRVAWPAGGSAMHPWFREPPPEGRWPELVDAARRAGAPWSELLAGRIDEIVAGTRVAAASAEPTATGLIRCHLDFNRDNVLVDRDGGTWVIDWENSGAGHPSQELAQAVIEVGGDDPGDFLEGYAAGGGPARFRDLGDFAMAFVVQANLLALYARRWLDGDAATRPRDEWRLSTLVPELLTVTHAEEVLARSAR